MHEKAGHELLKYDNKRMISVSPLHLIATAIKFTDILYEDSNIEEENVKEAVYNETSSLYTI